MSAPLVELENVSVSIPVPSGALHAVRDVSLTVARGESLGIVGESGSGKSMTAMALMRLLPRTAKLEARALRYDGQSLTELDDAHFASGYLGPKMAMIFQEPMTSLNPVYSVGRQLTEAVVRNGLLSSSEAHRKAVALLDRVGIDEPDARMSQYPHQMSGGQRQRVMIAMALMQDPELLIADEPTTALDVTVQAEIMKLLNELRHERGMALILITHDLALIAESTDSIAVMYGGEILEQGTTSFVIAHPAHPYTRALMAAVPRLDGKPRRLMAIPGSVPSVLVEPKGCIFAPRCTHVRDICLSARPPVRGDATQSRLCVLNDAEVAELPSAVPEARLADAGLQEEPILVAEGVTRLFSRRRGMFGPRHDIRAVDNVSLTLNRGETLAVVGESGSGKTTLARILLGLDLPSSGDVLLDGEPVTRMDPKRRAELIQPIFQDPYSSLNPRHTVGDIIMRPLALRQQGSAEERLQLAREQMDHVRLSERYLYSYPSQLSGGQRQRVAIARALISSPEILVCDEPTSALDVSVQAQILDILIELQRTLGLTTLLITHDMAVVRQIASRIVVMLDGAIVERGSTEDILDHPQTEYARRLISAAPRFSRDQHTFEVA